MLHDAWENLETCNYKAQIFAQSYIAIKKRYIYQFGYSLPYVMQHQKDIALKKDSEIIFKLDTFNLKQGWSCVRIKTPFESGCQYGILPLSDIQDYKGNDKSTLIFFGGLNNEAEALRQTILVTLDNKTLENSKLSELKLAL